MEQVELAESGQAETPAHIAEERHLLSTSPEVIGRRTSLDPSSGLATCPVARDEGDHMVELW
eukprot:6083965-Amphidinium_carterae.1